MRVALAIVLFIAGTLAAEHIVVRGGREDPQIVVMDEVVGMGLTLACTHTWAGVIVGTALFRLFDIVKPWPVSLADRRIKGGFGVMFDDVLAAGYAWLVLTGLEHFVFPALHL